MNRKWETGKWKSLNSKKDIENEVLKLVLTNGGNMIVY